MINTILCVDDDPITLMLSKMVIKKAAFCNEIATAQNGEQAMLFFENLLSSGESHMYPKFIFLDLNMPVMNGWEFLNEFTSKNLNQVFKEIKVIILSSTVDPEDIKKVKQYPIVIKFLSKPINKEMLETLKNLE